MRNRLWGFIVIGVSLMLSALIFGFFFYQSRLPQKTIRVVGTSSQRFQSDIIKWRITLVRTTGLYDLKDGFALMNKDLAAFTTHMLENGIDEKNVTVQPPNSNHYYGQNGQPAGYQVTANAYVISDQVDILERLALNPAALTGAGIVLQASNLEYYYSGLADIKRELLAAATKDARRRAEEIAKGSGDRIANIVSARTGVFQINEPYSTDVSDYGIYNTAAKEKEINVTISVVFGLK